MWTRNEISCQTVPVDTYNAKLHGCAATAGATGRQEGRENRVIMLYIFTAGYVVFWPRCMNITAVVVDYYCKTYYIIIIIIIIVYIETEQPPPPPITIRPRKEIIICT